MADSDTPDGVQQWTEFAERMNEQFLDALEANVEAQAEFVESWTDAVESSVDDDRAAEGVGGYARAYQAWMEAAGEMVDRVGDAAAGEEVEPEEFRDVWLDTANRAFKEVMGTTAFAAATGETVSEALEARQQADETAETTLHGLGLPTEGDVQEVGERLVELERRQHAVERKLERVLEAVDE